MKVKKKKKQKNKKKTKKSKKKSFYQVNILNIPTISIVN